MSDIVYTIIQFLVDVSPLIILLYFVITAIKGFMLFVKGLVEK